MIWYNDETIVTILSLWGAVLFEMMKNKNFWRYGETGNLSILSSLSSLKIGYNPWYVHVLGVVFAEEYMFFFSIFFSWSIFFFFSKNKLKIFTVILLKQIYLYRQQVET